MSKQLEAFFTGYREQSGKNVVPTEAVPDLKALDALPEENARIVGILTAKVNLGLMSAAKAQELISNPPPPEDARAKAAPPVPLATPVKLDLSAAKVADAS